MNMDFAQFLNAITKRGKIDLHSHSTASDGSFTPFEVYRLAQINRLCFFALSDHDTISGVEQLLKENITLIDYMTECDCTLSDLKKQFEEDKMQKKPLLIPSIELSVDFEGQNVHLLGYFSGADIKGLEPYLAKQQENRRIRNCKLIKRLQAIGLTIPDNYLENEQGNQSKGRVDIAKWLVKNQYCKDIKEAFENYLEEGKIAYIPREKTDLTEAAQAISDQNGFPVIAHPHQYGWCKDQKLATKKILALQEKMPIGIEVFHSAATLEQQNILRNIVLKYNLVMTAGSDFHGLNKVDHDLYTEQDLYLNHYKK